MCLVYILIHFVHFQNKFKKTEARGFTLRKVGWGCAAHLPNPYPIYDYNQPFLLPYLWPEQNFYILFTTAAAGKVALNISYEGRLLMVLPRMMKKQLLLRNIPNSRLECKNHALFMTKMAKITKTDTLFMTKTAEKPYPLGLHIPT